MPNFEPGPSPIVSHCILTRTGEVKYLRVAQSVDSWQGDSTVYTQLAHEFKNLRFPKYFPVVQLRRYIVTKNNHQKLLTS